jgi:hypothetical protein
MKFTLSGLLLFSQAASALIIDKTNYNQHLCDNDMFKPASVVSEDIPEFLKEAQENVILGDYQAYCQFRSYYEEAKDNAKTATWRTHKPCGGNPKDLIEPSRCMEKQGIYYAQACEKLKQDRASTPTAWNSIVTNIVSCNNM